MLYSLFLVRWVAIGLSTLMYILVTIMFVSSTLRPSLLSCRCLSSPHANLFLYMCRFPCLAICSIRIFLHPVCAVPTCRSVGPGKSQEGHETQGWVKQLGVQGEGPPPKFTIPQASWPLPVSSLVPSGLLAHLLLTRPVWGNAAYGLWPLVLWASA